MENNTALSTEQRDAFRLDAEIRQHAGTVITEMIEIGRCLKEINDRKLYEYLGYNGLADYAEAAVGLKERAAYNYITAYETYGSEGMKKYGEIGITKLVALAQLSDVDRKEMLESGTAAEMSTRKLNEEIKRLKGENDQLRFDAEDAEKSAKSNAEQVAEQKKALETKDAEIEKLKKDLEEAQRPVVASMTDEEKAELRKAVEKEAEEKQKKKIEKAEKEHKKDVATYEKAIKEHQKEAEEQENKIKELTSQLEAANAENAKLQANAEKAKKPVLAGSEEALKFCLEDIQQQFARSVEIVGKMESEKKEKFKAALVNISEKLKAAAEGIA